MTEEFISKEMAEETVIKAIEPSYTIVIEAKDKELTLDFNEGKLKTYGNMKYDKASKLFFEGLDTFFQGAIDKRKKEFIKRLKEELFIEAIERNIPLTASNLDRLPLAYINKIIDKIAGEK